ncbi:uncharacterized protein N0V89_010238 [Didymosphaeria variabile]|uniref:F-box domain-containing protein n=1 Tax=Didymosphaeria variabile TaxID=1932322 RepID=A0A9W8XFU1_9PLEO|nr:uncharacterized protein N0V89_010238 [Didymosphaeria variabile]KAJ4348859.1 hypothetical protein N0V89_010238 [Didymosphaeria variabile]
MPAASAVFYIPELLEHIISELPPFDIIHYQRVNRTWHKLIADSPLLQYKAWLRNDFPDPTQHVQPDDLIPKLSADDPNYPYASKAAKDYDTKRYIYNISKHLHPIIMANIMKDVPYDPSLSFDPAQDMDTWGFGGYFSFRPVLLRALRQWCEAHKSSEHVWGHISLYRPEARRINWDVSCSDDASIPFSLEARCNDDPNASRYSSDLIENETVVNKRPGEPLFLTLGDLFGRLDRLWNRWIDGERETHYLSHDGAGCDYDYGLPDYCLESSDEEDEDDEKDEDEKMERHKFGVKMTEEEHIDACVERASK